MRGNKNKRQEDARGGEDRGTIEKKWEKLKKTVLDEMIKGEGNSAADRGYSGKRRESIERKKI